MVCFDLGVARADAAQDEAGVVERAQIGADRIGEAALLAHLGVEPRIEAAAAQDVVHDQGRVEIGIVRA